MIKVLGRISTLFILLAPITVWAQDLTGFYRLDAVQDAGQNDCVWSGTLQLTQSGGNPGTFVGSGSALLAVGSAPCADFTGTATGNINGSTLDFGIGVGGLGTVVFNGSVAGDGSLSGSWAGFATFTGTWSATPVDSTPVPVLPWPMLSVLLAVIGGIGALRIRRSTSNS